MHGHGIKGEGAIERESEGQTNAPNNAELRNLDALVEKAQELRRDALLLLPENDNGAGGEFHVLDRDASRCLLHPDEGVPRCTALEEERF
jgi:hypothetical protein